MMQLQIPLSNIKANCIEEAMLISLLNKLPEIHNLLQDPVLKHLDIQCFKRLDSLLNPLPGIHFDPETGVINYDDCISMDHFYNRLLTWCDELRILIHEKGKALQFSKSNS